jgi:hypothetical protein
LLSAARMVFASSVGFSLVMASLVAGIPARGWMRWTALMLLVALQCVVSRSNLSAWNEAARAVRAATSAAPSLLESAPPGGRVLVYGLPAGVRGAFCFHNSAAAALQRASGRRDLEIVEARNPGSFGRFDRLLEFRASPWRLQDATDVAPTARIDADIDLTIELQSDSAEAPHMWVLNATAVSKSRNMWIFEAQEPDAVVALPIIAAPPGGELSIEIDGCLRLGDEVIRPPPVIALLRTRSGLERLVLASPKGRVPLDALSVRFEIPIPGGTRLELQRVRLRGNP